MSPGPVRPPGLSCSTGQGPPYDTARGSVVVVSSIEDAARVLVLLRPGEAVAVPGEGRRVALALDGPPGPALRAARAAGVSVARIVPGLGRLLRLRRGAGADPPPSWARRLRDLILRNSESQLETPVSAELPK